MTETLATAWGPLAEPVHADAADGTEPTWKDNAYLSFWDVEGAVYGTFHVSTSPNDPNSVAHGARCNSAGRSSRSSRSCREDRSPARPSPSVSTAR